MWNLLVLYICMESNKPNKCLDAMLGWILLTFRPIERYGKLKLPGAGTARTFYLLSIPTTLAMSSDWAAQRATI